MRACNPSNLVGTCLWCGRRLSYPTRTKYGIVEGRWQRPQKACKARRWEGTCQGELEPFREGSAGHPPAYACNTCGRLHVCDPLRRVVAKVRLRDVPGISGCFCTKGCAQAFGVAAAKAGYRMGR